MFNFPSEVQRLIYSYDYTYHDKYNKVLKHLKYISVYIMTALDYNLFDEDVFNYYENIQYIKYESKKLYPPDGSKFWGGLSDSDSDSD